MLKRAAGDTKEPVVVINADAQATHQSVIHVMEAARAAGFVHITFATQASPERDRASEPDSRGLLTRSWYAPQATAAVALALRPLSWRVRRLSSALRRAALSPSAPAHAYALAGAGRHRRQHHRRRRGQDAARGCARRSARASAAVARASSAAATAPQRRRAVARSVADDDARDAGDEPLILARDGLPVWVGADRAAAARALLAARPTST